MPADAEEVDVHFIDVDWYLTDGLPSIGVEEDSPFFADPPDFLYVLLDSDFVIHQDDTHTEDGFLGVVDGLLKERGVDQSILQNGQVGDSIAIALKQATNFQGGLVLDLRCDYVPPLLAVKPCQPFDDGVVGL